MGTEILDYLSARPLEVLNLILALVGFIILAIQTARAKSAADAAREAADNALGQITMRVTLADVYSVATSLREIQQDLRNGSFQVALLRCQLSRPELHKLRMRPGFSSEDRSLEIQQIITGMRKLEDTFERALAGSASLLDVPKANKILSDYSNQLFEWGEELKLTGGRANHDST